MLHIVFFARVKEQLGCGSVELEWSQSLSSLESVKKQLYIRDNGLWGDILSEDNIICAINHTVVNGNAPLSDNDEIAFFPPVTGG